MSQRYIDGSPILMGDATTPGLPLPPELKKIIPRIFKECTDFGLDFFPTCIHMLTYDEISEIASYNGFPVRYPHWKWGMEYEGMQHRFLHGGGKIFEMVVNTNPSHIYCLDSNPLVDHVTVIVHAQGHNHFFKNNVFFSQTNRNMLNEFANHGSRIRKYMSRWGKERVTQFLDYVLRLETLIDPAKAWEEKKYVPHQIFDKREVEHPSRLKIREGHDYMDDYINPKEWTKKQQKAIYKREVEKEIGLFKEPTKDVLGFLRDHAPLKPWQQDIISMIWEESIYFAPQRQTKTINEGFASYTDFNIMCKRGLCGLGQASDDCGIVDYAMNHVAVMGGKYSMNPYNLGFSLLTDIEDRWNKGKFGPEYDECKDMKVKEEWNLNLGLGKDKVFEVCRDNNDFTLLLEYFTPEFCRKNEFFEWKKYPNGEYRIEEDDPKKIKAKLIKKHLNGGLPEIRLVDPNHRGQGFLMLEHIYDGRTLHIPYVRPVMQAINHIWKKNVLLVTKDSNGDELVYHCFGDEDKTFGEYSGEDYRKLLG